MKSRTYTPQELKASIAKPNWIVRRETRNDRTRASNPCQTRFETLHYFRCHPILSLVVVPSVALLVGFIGWFKHWDLWLTVSVAIGGILVGLVSIITQQMKKFAVGDVNPAYILDGSHIAAFVDLNASRGNPRYAVKVISAPLTRMAGGPYQTGDRVSVTCFYFGPPDASGAWQGVSTFPVAAGTTNPIALARLEASIPEEKWAQAKTYVAQVKSPTPQLLKLW